MTKLHILAIGGTGSRVLRSLTMLLATGVSTRGYEIVPYIIDPDAANADLSRNNQLMKLYSEIHGKLTFAEGGNTFFKTPIIEACQNFTIQVPNTSNSTYENFIGLSNMSREDQAMARMLFSDKNLTSTMDVGFKGNPNIGSVVLNQIASTEAFGNFANSFVDGDKIFIISSIFGGTGASGFPLLLKTLRHNSTLPNAGAINNAEIGAISVLPYFALKQNSNSSIDSSTFYSKTRAALTYYANNVTDADALYYIGHTPKKFYNNHEGGAAQENDANFIELLAATAIVDFCSKSFKNGQTSYLEIGLNPGGTAKTLNTLPDNMSKNIAHPLLRFAIFAKSVTTDWDFVSDGNFKANKGNGIKSEFYNDQFPNNVRQFAREFCNWLEELKGNSPSFVPFNISSSQLGELNSLATDITTRRKYPWAKNAHLDNDSYRSELNGAKVSGATTEDKFMGIHCKAAAKLEGKYIF